MGKAQAKGSPSLGTSSPKKKRSSNRTLTPEVARREMKLENLPEQLFVSAVDMDPTLDGFSGVLVEIYRERDSSGGFRYVLLETASATGNQLLKFSSKDKELIYAALNRELGTLPQRDGR
jgi:hypothetical protein